MNIDLLVDTRRVRDWVGGLRICALAWGFLGVGVGCLEAQTDWLAAGGGAWGNAANWSGGLPTVDLAVSVTRGGVRTVVVDGSTLQAQLAARRLNLAAPAGSSNTLRLENLGARAFSMPNTLSLAAGGALEIVSSTLTLDGALGGAVNIQAGAILIQNGSLLTTRGASVRVGRTRLGQMSLQGGVLVDDGDLVVGGLAGSEGVMRVEGGSVRVNGQWTVGDDAGSVGRVMMTDGFWVSTNAAVVTRIGDDGEGHFALSGGTVLMGDVSVARSSGSRGWLSVGGGRWVSDTLSLGRFAGATGQLVMTGGIVDLGPNLLWVGRQGSGSAVLSNGVLNAEAMVVAGAATAAGVVEMQGGTVEVGSLWVTNSAGSLKLGSGVIVVRQSSLVTLTSPVVVGDGVNPCVLQLDGGEHRFAGGLIVESHAILQGNGKVTGSVTVRPGGVNRFEGVGPQPPFSLTPQWVGGRFELSFPSVKGRRYEVLGAGSLDGGGTVWTVLAEWSGTGSVMNFTNSLPGAMRFFRVNAP